MSPSRMRAVAVHSPVATLKKLLRRRKLKAAAPLPPPPDRPTAPIECLPAPIVGGIARHLDSWDVLNLGLCSRRLRALLAPALYSRVELKTNRQCKSALVTLAKYPNISQYVHQLIVRVNPIEWTNADERMDEDLVATLIAKLAVKLQRLESFEWDGLEMPHDELWLALKTNCPSLKRIATTVGEEPMSASSPLWDFEDLRKFSLTVKCQSLDWITDSLPKTEKLPRKFWVMLLERSPRLEELAIAGPAPSPRIFDIRHVMAGRWPRLRRITLGDMALISPTRGEDQIRKNQSAFMAFLAAHPTLRGLHLQQAAASLYFPTTFVLPPGALPNLTAFTGPLTLLRTLPSLYRLQTVNLTTLHHSTSSFPPTFAVLRDLENLTSLSIWIDLSFGQVGSLATNRSSQESMRKSSADDILMLRSLALLVQNIKHLDILCFSRPTFHVRDLSRVLQNLPCLESFTLTKVSKTNEEDLTKNALRIVTENRQIKQFTVRLTWDSWFSSMRGRIKHQGTYEVFNHAVDAVATATAPSKSSTSACGSGEPNTAVAPPIAHVIAHECGQKSITGKDYSRHTVHEIFAKAAGPTPPPSSFGRHRHSLSLSRMPSYSRRSSASASTNNAYASDSEVANTSGRGAPESEEKQSHSRSSSISISSGFFARVRRRSASMVATTTAGYGSVPSAPVSAPTTVPISILTNAPAKRNSALISPTSAASPRSSVSSFSPSAASHGGSVTWADRDLSSLGRSGSSSSGGGGGGAARSRPSPADGEDGEYVLV